MFVYKDRQLNTFTFIIIICQALSFKNYPSKVDYLKGKLPVAILKYGASFLSSYKIKTNFYYFPTYYR